MYVKSLGNNMEIICNIIRKVNENYYKSICMKLLGKDKKIIVKTVVTHRGFTQMKSIEIIVIIL